MDNESASALANAPLGVPPPLPPPSPNQPGSSSSLSAAMSEYPAKRPRLSHGASSGNKPPTHQRLPHLPELGLQAMMGSTDPVSAAGPSHPPDGQYVRRKRALAACRFCRLRKTKCDNVRPVCGSCRRHQARCVYEDGSEADAVDEAAIRHREVLERLDDIRSLLATADEEKSESTTSPGTAETHGGVSRHHAQPSSSSTGPALSTAPTTAYLKHTKCESILKWPVLRAVMTQEDAAIDSFIFDAYVPGDEEAEGDCHMKSSPLSALEGDGAGAEPSKAAPLQSRTVIALCEKFLALVNCRNPILDAHDLLSYATSVAKKGPEWNAESCLVLIACALASYSRTWTPPASIHTPMSSDSPAGAAGAPRRHSAVPLEVMSTSDDDAAEGYYEAAQKRFGCLGTSLVAIQCFYFASLFEKFAFRPIQAWMHLQQAATRLRLHHLGQGGPRPEPSLSTGSHHFEQRAFWSIHKAEREFATELGFTLASDLDSFKYPAAFPTPPETLHHLMTTGSDEASEENDDEMPEVFSPRRNETIWFFYVAQISLRRTLDEVLSVMYEKGEQYWVENIDLICRQYHESRKQIADWRAHLPPTMRYDPATQPNNEMGYYLEGRFEEWNEFILRPLVYYCLHAPRPATAAAAATATATATATKRPLPGDIAAWAQDYMTLCSDCIMRCSRYDRHGGTWYVLRRATRCCLVVLAAVVADGPLRPPENWRELSRVTVATLERWSEGVRDMQRMRRVVERVFHAVCDFEDSRREDQKTGT